MNLKNIGNKIYAVWDKALDRLSDISASGMTLLIISFGAQHFTRAFLKEMSNKVNKTFLFKLN